MREQRQGQCQSHQLRPIEQFQAVEILRRDAGFMNVKTFLPALTPEAPAFFKPFFLTMKLAPMKKLEDKANTNPLMLSEDMPLYESISQLSYTTDPTKQPPHQKPYATIQRDPCNLAALSGQALATSIGPLRYVQKRNRKRKM